MDDTLWNAQDVTRFLRCSLSWVQKAAARGDLPCLRIGRMLRFDPDAIRAFARGERGTRPRVRVLRQPGE